MASSRHTRILPMKTAGTQHLIDRTYRESGQFQWVRETFINAGEANSTLIEFGIEWQAVENRGVYRRQIADNGCGMTSEELVEFFNTFGGGGKPIGGVHENFGVGCKTSLLPWNRYGVVVISWVDGMASMIWIQQDEESGEYGLKLVEAYDPDTDETSLETVYQPFDDPDHGCDWALVKPSWIDEHGTVIVLMGNEPTDDTVHGDPNRQEDDIKGISAYLNRRLWDLSDDVRVFVDELRTEDRAAWPTSEEIAHGSQTSLGPDRRTNRRQIRGARYFIEYRERRVAGGKLADSGTIELADSVEVDWFLWEGSRPAVQSYAAISGYIGTLYKDELYDVSTHPATYRSFGITDGSVRQRVWLVIRPTLADADGKYGVYPRTDRNSLLLRGGPNAGGPLPLSDWGAQFSDRMPQPIQDALREARVGQTGTVTDTAWRDRLAERFASRWRITKLRVHALGDLTVTPTQAGTRPATRRVPRPPRPPQPSRPRSNGAGRAGQLVLGTTPGPEPARKSTVGGAIPDFDFVRADAIEPGMLAAWVAHHPDHPSGVVLINVDHPVLRQQVDHWQRQYADHLAEQVEQDVLSVYGEVAVAKVAHTEHLKSVLPAPVVETDLRSPAALTTALLGLMAEEAIIAPRLGGKYSKRRVTA